MKASEKNTFYFNYFNELRIGDVFKFEKTLDSDLHSIFFTVYSKDEKETKINSTYGKKLVKFSFKNELQRNIIIFPNRSRSINSIKQ